MGIQGGIHGHEKGGGFSGDPGSKKTSVSCPSSSVSSGGCSACRAYIHCTH